MVPFHISSFHFACFVPVVFFIACRLTSSFRVLKAVVSSKHQFAKILPRTDALETSVIGEVFRIQKPVVPIVENLFLRCSTYWGTKANELCLGILKAGPTPKHVALIMDGNRRYSRKRHTTLEQGYISGCAKIKEMLKICFGLNVKCVTLYCFSLENFNRQKEEVDMLMEMLADLTVDCAKPGHIVEEYAMRVNLLGKKELVYETTRVRIEDVERRTRDNQGAILNLCIAYGSRDEITTAVERCIQSAVDSDSDKIPNITEDDINAQLMTSRAGCPPVDILLRTGGDKRLSDFLLWQCCENTQIHFNPKFWPEIDSWDLVPIILDFQRKVWNLERTV